jgi:hypothetical protein
MTEPKMNPSFRKEDQNMAEELKPVVVGPPAYASPDPATNSGALVPVEQHPFDLDKDYGAGVADAVPGNEGDAADAEYGDEDEWTKERWQEEAEKLNLSKSGTKDEVRARVEEAWAAEQDDNDNDES